MTGVTNEATESTELIFLSHSGADTEAAKGLASLLRQGGVDVWLDVERLPPGDVWMDQLEAALVTAKHFIVYIGPSGVRNWVGREVRFALDRSTRDRTFRLVPVLGPGADAEALPLFLKQHQWLDLRDRLILPQELKRFLQSMTGLKPAEISLLGPNQSPFRGLFAFEEEDALLFYGRDKETDELVKKLALDRFLAVVGDSGSGKSSLVKAGLIPALHGGRLALATGETASWRVCVARPADAFRELAEGLAQLDSGLSAADSTAFVAEAKRQMATGTEGLRNAIAGLRIPRTTRVLVVIDQFEELFTAGADKEEQLRYINTLLAAVPIETDHRVHLVITLRADFYSQCWVHPDLPKRIAANQFAVQRMDREQLREAIQKPLVLAGIRTEAGLVDTLLNEVGDEPGNLPLLEHALEQLWEKRAEGIVTNAAYENIGRLKGSLRHYADEAYKTLGNEEKRDIARKILVRLTQLGEGSQDTRRRTTKAELLAAAGGQPDAQQVLDKLVSARLITVGTEQQTRRDVVEVAHEALIREWPLLRGWVNEDRQDLRVERAILLAAQEWESFGRDTGTLWKGARLAQAEEWSGRHEGELPDSACEFLRISIASRDDELREEKERQQIQLDNAKRLGEAARKSAKRTRVFSAALAVLLFGSLGLAWYAQRTARESKARELAAYAMESLSADPERSILLGMQAVNATIQYGQGSVPAAEEALHQAILSSQVRMTLRGHSSKVVGVVFSPDGKRLATASGDKTARVWDAESGMELLTLHGHSDTVHGVAFSPDGKRLATASGDKTAKVWDAESGKELLILRGHWLGVDGVAFSPDGKRLATASDDTTARVWDAESGKELLTLRGHSIAVDGVAFSPDGKRLATTAEDTMVWDAQSGKELLTLRGHTKVVDGVAFSPDGKRLATASLDDTAKVWDAESGRELLTLRGHSKRVYVVAFSSDGKRLAIASDDTTARVWDAESGMELLTLHGHSDTVDGVAFSPDGKRLATASWDKTAKVWDAESGKELLTLRGHWLGVDGVAFSPDGKRLATANWDATVWDAESGKELLTLRGHSDHVNGVAFSPDGRRLATASWDKMAKVWEVESGKVLLTLRGHSYPVYGVAFSPDGKRLATASLDDTAKVWDAESGKELLTLRGHSLGVYAVAFNPDGKRLATASGDPTAKVWDAESGKELLTLRGHTKVVDGVAFSPDGKRLATASWDKTAKVWDAESGKELLTLRGHSLDDVAFHMAFSPDGKRLATTGEGTAVWDAESGKELLTLRGHSGTVDGVAFSPNGKRLATASWDSKTVQIYTLDLRELLHLARSRVTRPLTTEECQRYFQSATCPPLN